MGTPVRVFGSIRRTERSFFWGFGWEVAPHKPLAHLSQKKVKPKSLNEQPNKNLKLQLQAKK